MASARMDYALEGWDTLMTFTSYERTPQRVKWMRDSYEIEGSIDDWLENKFSNVIDEYATLLGIPFVEAAEKLKNRPIKPWPSKKNTPEQSPFEFHMKPSGWTGAPCPICGCTTKNLRAPHRALKADEAYEWGVSWVKRIKVAFGTDSSIEPLRE